MKNLFKKLCKNIKFNEDMVKTLAQPFLVVDDSAENYWLCTCERTKLIKFLQGDNIISADCRLFVHLCALVLTGDKMIIFQMPRKLGGMELLIPPNVFYLYPDSPYRHALGSCQGQFLFKHGKKYYGFFFNEGVKAHTIAQWKEIYLKKIEKICNKNTSNVTLTQCKCILLRCQIKMGKVKLKLANFQHEYSYVRKVRFKYKVNTKRNNRKFLCNVKRKSNLSRCYDKRKFFHRKNNHQRRALRF